MQNLVTQILADRRASPASEATLKGTPGKPGLVQTLRDKYIDRQAAALQQSLADPNLDEAAKLAALTRLPQLRQYKRQPLMEKGEG